MSDVPITQPRIRFQTLQRRMVTVQLHLLRMELEEIPEWPDCNVNAPLLLLDIMKRFRLDADEITVVLGLAAMDCVGRELTRTCPRAM